jgi:hypothetical protein
MFGEVPRDVASWPRPYLVAKLPHVGIDADGLSYPLHHPIACGCQTRVQSPWSGTALLYMVTKLLLKESLSMQVHML